MDTKNIHAIFKSNFFILILILFLGLLYVIIENNINPANVLNIDEGLWIERSYNYLYSVGRFDFVGGIQTVHPGITVMSICGIFIGLAEYFFGSLVFYHSNFLKLYLFAFDIPIIALMLIFFFSFYRVLRKMKFNRILSFLVLIFISVNLSYILDSTPTDKFATISILLSLSFLLVYVNGKFFPKKYLFLASFLAAFGALSKLSALTLIPFSLFVLLYFSPLNSQKYKGALKDFLLYIAFFFISSVLIFPGFLFDFFGSANAIIGMSDSSLDLVLGLGKLPEPHPFYEKLSFHLGFFANGAFTPLATGFFFFFLIFVFKKFVRKGIDADFSEKNLFYKNVFVLFMFSFAYFLCAAYFSSLLYYRYMLPAFLIFDIGAAIGLYEIILWYRKRRNVSESVNITAIKLITVFYVFQFFHLLLIYGYCISMGNI